jgi:hypothetical protein
MTEGGDIQFRVYTNNSEGGTFDLVPLCRVDSHLAMEEGQITCGEPGKCNLHLWYNPVILFITISE